MSISRIVTNKISSMPKGKVFGYDKIPAYRQSPGAVVKAISRMVSSQRLKKLSKGKFYIEEIGIIGPKRPSDSEILRSNLFKNGKLRGYETGLSLYNKLGLTTQLPLSITISRNGSRQKKEFGTIIIKAIGSRCPIEKKNIKLFQYLDALKDIKKVSGSDTNESLKIIAAYISELSENKNQKMIDLALKYYPPRVKALLGLLLSSIGLKAKTPKLKTALNPTTIYKLGLNSSIWPESREWNIK